MLYAFQNVAGVPQKKRALPRRDKMHQWNEFRTYINQRLISETTQSLQEKNVGPSGLPIVKRDTIEILKCIQHIYVSIKYTLRAVVIAW
jgi:hypothetical protein